VPSVAMPAQACVSLCGTVNLVRINPITRFSVLEHSPSVPPRCDTKHLTVGASAQIHQPLIFNSHSSIPAALSLILLLSPVPSISIWPFPPKRCINSSHERGLDGDEWDRIVAFGDFDGDKLCVASLSVCRWSIDWFSNSLDVLSLDSDQQILSVYLWDHSQINLTNIALHISSDYFILGRCVLKASSIQHPTPVYNFIQGDFTHDSKLDLLVMSSNRASTGLDMIFYMGNHDGSFSETYPFVQILPT